MSTIEQLSERTPRDSFENLGEDVLETIFCVDAFNGARHLLDTDLRTGVWTRSPILREAIATELIPNLQSRVEESLTDLSAQYRRLIQGASMMHWATLCGEADEEGAPHFLLETGGGVPMWPQVLEVNFVGFELLDVPAGWCELFIRGERDGQYVWAQATAKNLY